MWAAARWPATAAKRYRLKHAACGKLAERKRGKIEAYVNKKCPRFPKGKRGHFSLSKKSSRTFLTALLPPSILPLAKCCFARKALKYQGFSVAGYCITRRALPPRAPLLLYCPFLYYSFLTVSNVPVFRKENGDIFIRRSYPAGAPGRGLSAPAVLPRAAAVYQQDG